MSGGGLPSVVFGSMALTDSYNPNAHVSEAASALEHAFDRGVRAVHTAGHYGDGEAFRVIRRVLDRHPAAEQVSVIAKIDGSPSRLLDGDEGIVPTMRAIGRDHIEHVQLVESRPGYADHWSLEDVMDDLEREGELAKRLHEATADGTVGHLGIEVYDELQLDRAALIDELDFIVSDTSAIRQMPPLDRVPARVATGEAELVAIRPLCGGWLTPSYRRLDDFDPADNRREWYSRGEAFRGDVAELFEANGLGILEGSIRFVCSLPHVASFAVGMRTPAQVDDVLDAVEAGPLPPSLVAAVGALFEQPVEIELD